MDGDGPRHLQGHHADVHGRGLFPGDHTGRGSASAVRRQLAPLRPGTGERMDRPPDDAARRSHPAVLTQAGGGPVANSGLGRELWAYMKVRKKWWLAPILIVLFLVGLLLVFAQGSALAPFIYTIF